MAVLRKVELLAINLGLKIVKQGQGKRRMLMRKFALQHRVPMFVGEEERLYGVPIEYLSSTMMKALLTTFEDETLASGGPIKLSCAEEMFESILDLVKAEKRSRDKATEDGGCGAEIEGWGRISLTRVE